MTQLIKILESKQTVFRVSDIQKITKFSNMYSVRNFLNKAIKKNQLLSPYRGIFTKKKFNIYELATKLKIPSYVSLDTVLYTHGVIFQSSQEITLISNDSRTKKTKKNIFVYHKINDRILYDPLGIEYKNQAPLATPERAFCDIVYLNKRLIHIDAPEQLNLEKLKEISNIYNKSTQNFISKFIEDVR